MALRTAASAVLVAATIGGCATMSARDTQRTGIPPALLREARPIGAGPRFHPAAHGPVIGPCRPVLGPRRGVHVELFAADRVVVIAGGIGVRGPVHLTAGRISAARCFGALVTLEPTGVILMRPGSALTLGDLFRGWGQPLSPRRAGPFSARQGDRVRVYAAGRRLHGTPEAVSLTAHGEIVVEVGPYVPPHTAYVFPPGA